MKINERNSALHFLNEEDPLIFSTAHQRAQIPQVERFMHQSFPGLQPTFSQRKQYISAPFMRAYERYRGKLSSVIGKKPIQQHGTFIVPTDPGHHNTIFYDLKVGSQEGGNIDISGTVVAFSKSKEMPEPYLFALWQNTAEESFVYSGLHSESYTMGGEDWLAFVYSMILFLKYCKLETKIIPAGSKGQHGQEKYVNETRSTVEILDSTWFTTTIKSDGFWVGADEGGFLRWQPVGPGRSEVDLVWVSAFQKEGYTRRAKVLKNDE